MEFLRLLEEFRTPMLDAVSYTHLMSGLYLAACRKDGFGHRILYFKAIFLAL